MTETAKIFTDKMILQRDKINHIWGYEDSADQVTVTVDGREFKGDVIDGKFDIELPPIGIRRDITMTVKGSSELVFEKVCFGDVFLLSGQSNMEIPVYRTFDLTEEQVKKADYPYIRQYRLTPERDYKDDSEYRLPDLPWTEAVQGEIEQMSAYGFFCFKRFYDETEVPVGLVLNAQGGSTVQAFMSEDDMKDYPDEYKDIEEYWGVGGITGYINANEQRNAKWREATEVNGMSKPSDTIPSDAVSYTVPSMLRADEGCDITGSSWFYKEFELESVDNDSEGFLYAGMLTDADRTYINGIEVGRTEYTYPPRKYRFPSDVLKKGKNLIAIRLLVEGEVGGFVPYHPYFIQNGDTKIDLEGEWKMIKETSCEPFIPGRLFMMFPSILYKASVKTLRGLSFKAVLWYQGESNAGEPGDYDVKFEKMVRAWRKIFGEDLPFIVTEMPDFINSQNKDTSAVPEGWQEIQRMQREAQDRIPLCRVVSARDLGCMFELHPQRKDELGERAYKVIKEFLY